MYCVYLTTYLGNKLPMFYIGSSSIIKISQNYHGSVRSKKYRDIWEYEIKNSPHLFKTKIVTYHETRESATATERRFHMSLNVVKSSMYINLSVASENGFFGMDVCGKNNPRYGAILSEETRSKMSLKLAGNTSMKLSREVNHRDNPNYAMKGKKQSERQRLAVSKAAKARLGTKQSESQKAAQSIKMKGKGNPSFGKKLYNNGKINKRFKDEPVDKSWVLGGLPKKPEIKLTCHHCGITSNTGNIKRWHLDNCKLFPTI